MRLSVVVPVLNDAHNLGRVLGHLAAECPEADVIVVDGGSADGSAAVPMKYLGIRLVTSDRGRARQMNAGASAASGDVLLFLHADSRLPAGASAAIEKALQDPRVVGGRFDVRLDSACPMLRVVEGMMNLRSRLTGISTGDQAIFARRTVFNAMGGYAEIPLMEDVEFTRRLKRQGRLAALGLCVTTSARKWETEGILRTILLMWALRILYFAGMSPARLHRWYYPRLLPPEPPARDVSSHP
ncbi:MAG: TIGR04283 family arsenosugar biosynthesis glycosyltransferase [candidate division NC10 bacterium]|nr:TIGR04283 family arsenosugar biosynthesis glycosyltransferase [candidate division NC10 bacterium]